MRAAAALVGGGLLVLVSTPQGCGGSFSTSDAGASDAASDGQGVEAGCIVPPNGVGGEGDFCNWYAAYLSHCGNCMQCSQLDENDCVTLGDAMSDSFRMALVGCGPGVACMDVSMLTADPCVHAKLAATTPNSAQQSVKTAFCNSCMATNAAACNHFFDFAPDAGDNDGFGLFTMVMNDQLDAKIAAQCSSQCSGLGYSGCALGVLCGTGGAPQTHCAHGLCKL